MRVLLDTHVLLWAVDNPRLLGPQATIALQDLGNELHISAATIWELSIKVGLSKLQLSLAFRDWMNKAVGDLSATILPSTVEYANIQASLPFHHRDPFDRLMIAQAIAEQIPIVSSDAAMDSYSIQRIW